MGRLLITDIICKYVYSLRLEAMHVDEIAGKVFKFIHKESHVENNDKTYQLVKGLTIWKITRNKSKPIIKFLENRNSLKEYGEFSSITAPSILC